MVSKKLNELGFDIFTDVCSANVGNNIVRYFNEQIEKCDCFVFVVAEKFLEKSSSIDADANALEIIDVLITLCLIAFASI